MNHKKYLFGVFLLTLAMNSWSAYYFTTGNVLLAEMNNESTNRQTVAMMYVAAVASSLSTGYMLGAGANNKSLTASKAAEGIGYCIPNEATVNQLNEVVKKYLNDKPERLHEGSDLLILLAMRQAFPCNR